VSAAEVLIVEDEPMIGRILEHKLRREGHSVRWAKSAAQAQRLLLAGPADVALIDVTLEIDGIDWAGSLPALGLGPRVAWLALVGRRVAASEPRALDHGAANVVRKPFKPTLVAAEVARLLREAQR
jgi:two-component system nitrogen regulation response regulator GlnG